MQKQVSFSAPMSFGMAWLAMWRSTGWFLLIGNLLLFFVFIRSGYKAGLPVLGNIYSALLLPLFLQAAIIFSLAWSRWYNPQEKGPFAYTVSDYGIKKAGPGFAHEYKWSEFRKVKESRRFIFLHSGQFDVLVFPIRLLSMQGQLEAVRSLIGTHTAKTGGRDQQSVIETPVDPVDGIMPGEIKFRVNTPVSVHLRGLLEISYKKPSFFFALFGFPAFVYHDLVSSGAHWTAGAWVLFIATFFIGPAMLAGGLFFTRQKNPLINTCDYTMSETGLRYKKAEFAREMFWSEFSRVTESRRFILVHSRIFTIFFPKDQLEAAGVLGQVKAFLQSSVKR
ncbi:YcxB family protein [Amantichitinum ursilacus]|uniref:YcxB-like protein domain-containing protein n=1 Tax=Amantichitinum ursilacus TaxID=857265 RepID=A0A0N0GL03_9NEIS|nr:YcxB family protein [Amantichitinum ursilacus]KPC49594.1 hypothetical protein WG78_19765 [Amantichitinum ursilacus]